MRNENAADNPRHSSRSPGSADVGRAVLVRVNGNLYFTEVKRFSPSGEYVELSSYRPDMVDPGWRAVQEVELVEVIEEPNTKFSHDGSSASGIASNDCSRS